MSEQLKSWHDTPTRAAIVDFVERVTQEGGPDFVPPAERIATFDNDGTLWCEKPMPIELGFVLRRLAEMAEADDSLREKQPWKAAREQDQQWLGGAITKHYHGDDTDVKVLMAGILQAFAGKSVEEYAVAADAFLRGGKHPTLERTFHACGYLPMVELLGYLEANGFTNYIASGGDRDFMRPVTEEIYGIPSERVIGSSNALRYLEDEHGGTVTYAARARRLRRRPGQAGPDLEPDRPPADPRRRQLERRHRNAPVRRREGSAGTAAARPPRRCRP